MPTDRVEGEYGHILSCRGGNLPKYHMPGCRVQLSRQKTVHYLLFILLMFSLIFITVHRWCACLCGVMIGLCQTDESTVCMRYMVVMHVIMCILPPWCVCVCVCVLKNHIHKCRYTERNYIHTGTGRGSKPDLLLQSARLSCAPL